MTKRTITKLAAYLSLVCIALATGCRLQPHNSFSADDLYGKGAQSSEQAGGESAEFLEARSILRARCASCHTSFARFSESQWIANQYVVPGDPRSSALYQRLRGANVGGPENMPQGRALAGSELAAIYNWIANLKEVDADEGPSAAERLTAAMTVLRNSCFSCHATKQLAQSADYFQTPVPAFETFTTDNDFVASELILPRNAQGSWLMRALKGRAIGTMPKLGEPLDTSAIATLEAWINGIGEP